MRVSGSHIYMVEDVLSRAMNHKQPVLYRYLSFSHFIGVIVKPDSEICRTGHEGAEETGQAQEVSCF